MTTGASAQSVHEQAEALFRKGKVLMQQEKFAEACAVFERSHQLKPNVSTLLNHANCREKNAQLATAWQLFIDAKRQTDAQPDETSQRLSATAAERARGLQPRISKLSFDVPPDYWLDGLEILRNADRVDPGAWSHLQPIDGGTYKITVRAPGHTEWSTTVVMKSEGDIQTIAIPKLDPVTPAAPRPDERPPPPPDPTPPIPPFTLSNTPPSSISQEAPRSTNMPTIHSGARRSLVLPIALGFTSLVLGGTAFAFSRSGDSIYDDATRERKDAKQEELWKAANKQRYIAQGFAAGAAACVGAAIYFYVRGGRKPAPPVAQRSIRIEPTASAGSMGLGLTGDW